MTLISARGNLSWLLIIVEHVSLNNSMNERMTTTISIFSVRFAPSNQHARGSHQTRFFKVLSTPKKLLSTLRVSTLSTILNIQNRSRIQKHTTVCIVATEREAKKAIKNSAFHCVFSPCLMAMNSELCGASFSLVECFLSSQQKQLESNIWDC